MPGPPFPLPLATTWMRPPVQAGLQLPWKLKAHPLWHGEWAGNEAYPWVWASLVCWNIVDTAVRLAQGGFLPVLEA